MILTLSKNSARPSIGRNSALNFKETIRNQLLENIEVKTRFLETNMEAINSAAVTLVKAALRGNKILICGNGGSAADAQHLAAELIAKLKYRRRALPALALTTDTSVITALANDDGFDQVFVRQVEAFGQEKDILIGISTSGNSINILKAVEQAKKQGLYTIILTGKNGGAMKEAGDLVILVPSDNTQRIQECHITVGHILCDIVEQAVYHSE
ncbi:MAG: D-sedoheptulose 7-phosphate isomerase [Candidatus Marinimicrobia bacterium]|nr:D-sedoheptulose 7-phosphate isomerase [Candidatus Neomarinimicrobiota bacterium]